MKKLVIKTSLFLSGLIPATALATTHNVFNPTDPSDRKLPELPTTAPKDFSELMGVIATIGRVMFGILIALSTVFILYAAFLYIISQGDEERIQTAKRILVYAIIGLVVGVLAGGVGVMVQSFLNTPS